jgi:hypothetical protein
VIKLLNKVLENEEELAREELSSAREAKAKAKAEAEEKTVAVQGKDSSGSDVPSRP